MSDGSDHNPKPATLADRVRSLKLASAALDRERSSTRWLPWVLCAILAGVSAYLGYRVAVADSAAGQKRPGGEDADLLDHAPGGVALEAGGYIVPLHRVQVSPKVGGQVVELFIEEDMEVKKGALLARLERAEYQFEYDRAEALVDQAWAKYAELASGNREEERKHAEAALKEARELRNQLKDEMARLGRSGLAASADELVKIESRLLQAEYKVEQAEQSNKMMQDGPRIERIEAAWAEYLHAMAERDRAAYHLENTEVRAFISGVILVKSAEVGNTVRPESFGQGLSASLCDMADLREIEVDVDVSERDLHRVYKGQMCKLWTEAAPKHIYSGRVSRLMPIANKGKASISVRVRIFVPAWYLLATEKLTAATGFGSQPLGFPGLTVPLAVAEGPQEEQPPDRSLRPEMRARVQFLKKE